MQTTAYYFAKIGFSSNANGPDRAGGTVRIYAQCRQCRQCIQCEKVHTLLGDHLLYSQKRLDALTRVLLGHKEALWPKKLEISHASQILTNNFQILVLSQLSNYYCNAKGHNCRT